MEMNKKVMKAALFVVLSSMAVGCQKEDFPTNTTENDIQTIKLIIK